MLKKPAGKSGRIGTGIERAVVGGQMAPKASDLALFGGRNFALHPVVADKRGGHQVVHPVFDPLHRTARDDRGDDGTDIPRIDPNLVAKAAANIGGHNADVAFRNARQQRRYRAHHLRCLKRAPKGLACH